MLWLVLYELEYLKIEFSSLSIIYKYESIIYRWILSIIYKYELKGSYLLLALFWLQGTCCLSY